MDNSPDNIEHYPELIIGLVSAIGVDLKLVEHGRVYRGRTNHSTMPGSPPAICTSPTAMIS